MTVNEAQRDLARAYVGGGPGVVVSAIVWLCAGFAEMQYGVGRGFAVLLLGGMLIFPIGTLASRTLFRRDKESSDNPLGRIALESTVAMIGGLFAAWLFLPFEPAYVFPLAAVAVGTHYAVFKSIYGDRLFWALGGLITLVGFLGVYKILIPGGPIFAVGVIEFIVGTVLVIRATSKARSIA